MSILESETHAQGQKNLFQILHLFQESSGPDIPVIQAKLVCNVVKVSITDNDVSLVNFGKVLGCAL